jgi:hypothetical protein
VPSRLCRVHTRTRASDLFDLARNLLCRVQTGTVPAHITRFTHETCTDTGRRGDKEKNACALKSCKYYIPIYTCPAHRRSHWFAWVTTTRDLTFSGGTGRGEHLVFRMKYDTSMRFGFQFRIRGGASSYAPGTCQVASGRPHMCAPVRPCGCAPLCAYVRPLKPKPPGTLWHLVAPCGTPWYLCGTDRHLACKRTRNRDQQAKVGF